MLKHKDAFRYCFKLAALDYTSIEELPNGYSSLYTDRPWFSFQTKYGKIKIGWRKRVIHIDWIDTDLMTTDLTSDNVTMGCYFIHAWTYGDCVKYLDSLHVLLRLNYHG